MISVLTVIYNPGPEIISCLNSLVTIAETLPLEIIVVDNNSTNQIATDLPEQFPAIRLIRSPENLGFGGGNNLGVRHASGDYLLFANPDLVLSVDAVRKMQNYLEEHPACGVAGPRTEDESGNLIYTARADYTVARLGIKYMGLDVLLPGIVYGDYPRRMQRAESAFPADWLQGSCLLVRRDVYEKIGGFDETFFLYMEDTDLCARIRQAGWQVVYLPDAIVTHVGGTTTARYHTLRVRSYHHSPIHYHRKQGHHAGVLLLKLVFSLELLAKVIVRSTRNGLNRHPGRTEQIKAEFHTLRQVWSF